MHVGFFEKMKHHAHALRANADEGEIEFVAWRDIAEAAENVAWNDGETKAGSGALGQEFAARYGIVGGVVRTARILHGKSPRVERRYSTQD